MPDWATTWAVVAVAVIPTTTLASILTAFLAKRLGVKPEDIDRYEDATDSGDGEN
jgi:NhaP-type Na+/H+ or K+/H+ antiporter